MEEGSHMLIEETIKVDLSNEPSNPKIIQLGKPLNENERKEFITIFKEKKEIFVWSYVNMPGLDPNLVVHNLNIKESANPVKQKLQKMHPINYMMVKEELQILLEVKFIHPIDYSE